VKKSLLILALFALCALSFAYTLSIKVTVTQDTLSVGSNVSLETQGVEIASGRTGNDGTVNFSVSNGSYFAILKSTIYPKQVTLLEVNGDTAHQAPADIVRERLRPDFRVNKLLRRIGKRNAERPDIQASLA